MPNKALLIGVDTFKEYDKIEPLHAVKDDIDAFHDLLNVHGNFELPIVVLTGEMTKDEAEIAVFELFNDAGPDDLRLLYFSGHGFRLKESDEDEHLYLALPGTKAQNPHIGSLSSRFIKNEIARSNSKKIAIILDCCNAGSFHPDGQFAKNNAISETKNDILENFTNRSGVFALVAAMANQSAFEKEVETKDGTKRRVSMFTQHLVNGIKNGEASDEDDNLDLSHFEALAVETAKENSLEGVSDPELLYLEGGGKDLFPIIRNPVPPLNSDWLEGIIHEDPDKRNANIGYIQDYLFKNPDSVRSQKYIEELEARLDTSKTKFETDIRNIEKINETILKLESLEPINPVSDLSDLKKDSRNTIARTLRRILPRKKRLLALLVFFVMLIGPLYYNFDEIKNIVLGNPLKTISIPAGGTETGQKVLKLAINEANKGIHETRNPKVVGEYWKAVDLDFNGNDRNKPWNAAFISWLFRETGNSFEIALAPTHFQILESAIQKGLFRFPDAYTPIPGDLVMLVRGDETNPVEQIKRGEAFDSFKGTTGVILKTENKKITAIGGNIGNSVSTFVRELDDPNIIGYIHLQEPSTSLHCFAPADFKNLVVQLEDPNTTVRRTARDRLGECGTLAIKPLFSEFGNPALSSPYLHDLGILVALQEIISTNADLVSKMDIPEDYEKLLDKLTNKHSNTTMKRWIEDVRKSITLTKAIGSPSGFVAIGTVTPTQHNNVNFDLVSGGTPAISESFIPQVDAILRARWPVNLRQNAGAQNEVISVIQADNCVKLISDPEILGALYWAQVVKSSCLQQD